MSINKILSALRESSEEGVLQECPYDLDELEEEFEGDWDAIMDEVMAWEDNLGEAEKKGGSGYYDKTACVKKVLKKWGVSGSDPNPNKGKPRDKTQHARHRNKPKSTSKAYKNAGQAAAAVCAWVGQRKKPGRYPAKGYTPKGGKFYGYGKKNYKGKGGHSNWGKSSFRKGKGKKQRAAKIKKAGRFSGRGRKR